MKKTEQRVNKAFTNATPNNFESVASDCSNTRQAAARIVNGNGARMWKIAACALAFVLIVAAVFAGVNINNQTASAAAITLDVNPSITIEVNKNKQVVSVSANNADGEAILANIRDDVKGSSLKLAVYAIIGSMYSQGYLNEFTNSVLVSVDSAKDMYEELAELVSGEIEVTLQSNGIAAAVVAQQLEDVQDEVEDLVEKYGLSAGKAQLIKKIAAASPTDENGNPLYTEEQLAALTVNELCLILANITVENVKQSGTSSQQSYIGTEKALQIALENFQISATEEQLKQNGKFKNKLDFEDGLLVYEVEFICEDYEYEAEINAVTGAVIKSEKSYNGAKTEPTTGIFTKEQLISFALECAGVPEAERASINVNFSLEDDGSCEVEFTFGKIRYELEISRYGFVIDFSREAVEENSGSATTKPDNGSGSGNTSGLTAQQIKEIVLKYVSAAETQISEWKIERDSEQGVSCFEVEFELNGMEYEIKINAATGSILKYETEPAD